ncbi:MAG: FAD:protein FMN transferase [Gammaproteobacteria bacterium]|nr:FAD:protein FMN transferase [Gammaproteobacteria bacterium]
MTGAARPRPGNRPPGRRHILGRCVVAALAFPLVLVLAAGCEAPPQLHQRQLYTFGTLVEVSLWGVEADLAEQAFEALAGEFDYMNEAWHAWRPGTLGTFNERCATGEPFEGDPGVVDLVRLGTTLSERSSGLFNPAIGRLVALWGFHADLPEPRAPPVAAIAELVAAAPAMTDIHLDDTTVRCTNTAVRLDFGAFAKGYGVDRAMERLRELGIDDAVINAGGDLRAIGSKGERPWQIGVRHPRGPGALARLEVAGDESVFTSGDYERHFEWQGTRYHHIIDPRTGWPSRGAASATVVHGDATTADAAATALMVTGAGAWPAVAARLGVTEALVITADLEIEMTPAMEQRLRLTSEPPAVRVLPLPNPRPNPRPVPRAAGPAD